MCLWWFGQIIITELFSDVEFHANPLWACPDNFTANSDMSLALGKRKTQGKLLSDTEGHRGFDKHSARTYILDVIPVGMTLSGVIYHHEEGFPVVFPFPFRGHFLKLSWTRFSDRLTPSSNTVMVSNEGHSIGH